MVFLSHRYLGFSWASGIVTINGEPYPNGLNQESSSESIAAYEGVALFGEAMTQVFFGSANRDDMQKYEDSQRIRDMGRLLLATEMRSAKTYWHVQDRSTPGVARIYPGTTSFCDELYIFVWEELVYSNIPISLRRV